MQKVNIRYSLKNIPVPNKIEIFFARMRWKAPFTLQKHANSKDCENRLRFKTRRYLPTDGGELAEFVREMDGVLDKIFFKKH